MIFVSFRDMNEIAVPVYQVFIMLFELENSYKHTSIFMNTEN
jgi:hypothetical protein